MSWNKRKWGNYSEDGYVPPYNRLRGLEVSQEYIDDIYERLQDWAPRPDSTIISTFFSDNGIGYSLFQYLRYLSPKLNNLYEIVIAELNKKWFIFGWNQTEKLPSHKEKMLLRYLRLYDHHAIDTETKKASEVAREKVAMEKQLESMIYERESYSSREIDSDAQPPFSDEEHPRRSEEETQ